MKKNKKIIPLLITTVYFFISFYCFSLSSAIIESYKPFTIIESILVIIFAIIGNIIMFGGSFFLFNLLTRESKNVTLASSEPKNDKFDYIIEENSEINTPPETRFSTARKINWEKLFSSKIKTGLKGEEIIFQMEKDYLKSIGKQSLANIVQHVSVEQGDGLGYDILSFFQDGREKYIEVKTTTQTIDSPYNISQNELNFLKENLKQAFIYRLSIQDKNNPTLEIKSAEEFLKNKQISPIQYRVK